MHNARDNNGRWRLLFPMAYMRLLSHLYKTLQRRNRISPRHLSRNIFVICATPPLSLALPPIKETGTHRLQPYKKKARTSITHPLASRIFPRNPASAEERDSRQRRRRERKILSSLSLSLGYMGLYIHAPT